MIRLNKTLFEYRKTETFWNKESKISKQVSCSTNAHPLNTEKLMKKFSLIFNECLWSATRAREGTWKQEIFNIFELRGPLLGVKKNCPVTPAPVPATTIPNLVLIYQVHLTANKVPKRGFYSMNWHFPRLIYPPLEKAFTEEQPHHVHHRFFSTF